MLLTRDAEKRPNAEELLRRRWANLIVISWWFNVVYPSFIHINIMIFHGISW
jgi:hypothetical protein